MKELDSKAFDKIINKLNINKIRAIKLEQICNEIDIISSYKNLLESDRERLDWCFRFLNALCDDIDESRTSFFQLVENQEYV